MEEKHWVKWGDGVEVLTRAMCGGCQDLKRRLKEAGIAFQELDVATVDGRAAAAWYDDPPLLPAAAVDGQLIEAGSEVHVLFKAVENAVRGRKAQIDFRRDSRGED